MLTNQSAVITVHYCGLQPCCRPIRESRRVARCSESQPHHQADPFLPVCRPRRRRLRVRESFIRRFIMRHFSWWFSLIINPSFLDLNMQHTMRNGTIQSPPHWAGATAQQQQPRRPPRETYRRVVVHKLRHNNNTHTGSQVEKDFFLSLSSFHSCYQSLKTFSIL